MHTSLPSFVSFNARRQRAIHHAAAWRIVAVLDDYPVVSGLLRLLNRFPVIGDGKKITAVHKANIMKLSDGLFLQASRKIAKRYPKIHYDEVIVDALCMKLVVNPNQFDILLCENLYGDIVSDLCSGFVGGLGMAPGANIGARGAVFEPVHGSAPDIAGKGIANPAAMILAAELMLHHLDEARAARRIHGALLSVLNHKKALTPDLGGKGTTETFTAAIVSAI